MGTCSDRLNYRNPHLNYGNMDSRWRQDDNKYKLSQNDKEQCANEANIMFLSSKLCIFMSQNATCLFSSEVEKLMFCMLFDLPFSEY